MISAPYAVYIVLLAFRWVSFGALFVLFVVLVTFVADLFLPFVSFFNIVVFSSSL